MSNIEAFKIESKDEADAYLSDLLKNPEYRSLGEVERRAAMLIPDSDLASYFIAKGAEQLG